MKRKKKSTFQPFNISFLDCICCGFGAVILLFVLTSGKKSEFDETQLSDVQDQLGKLSQDIVDDRNEIEELMRALAKNDELLQKLALIDAQLANVKADKTTELSLMLAKNAQMEDSLKELLGDLENMPKTEDPPPVPVANPLKRQYLTDFKMAGDRVVFLLEASGGMLGETADEAIARSSDSEAMKRSAPKWERSVKSIEWLLSALRPPTKYQIYIFNKDVTAILPEKDGEWLDLADQAELGRVIRRLNEEVPEGGANLEKAFWRLRSLSPLPDNVILVTDGLPTLSDTYGTGNIIDHETRIRMFHAAQRQLPGGVPVNTILFPMSGDPSAASLFWVMACRTQGSFVCPSRNWPDI